MFSSTTLFLPAVVAYPDFYAQTPLADVEGFSAGGDWGVMGIAKFEEKTDGACEVTSNISPDGFAPSTNYTITITSSVEGGVAHIVWPSAGVFLDAAEGESAPAHTHTTDQFTAKEWIWTSPEAVDAVHMYAICATQYSGKAYFVPHSLPAAPTPSPSPPAPAPTGACPEDAQEVMEAGHECLWVDGMQGFVMPPSAEAYCSQLSSGYFGYYFSGDYACAPSARRDGNYCLWEDGQRGVVIPAGASADCDNVSHGRIGFTLPSVAERDHVVV